MITNVTGVTSGNAPRDLSYVYGVHVTLVDEVRATQALYSTEAQALDYASEVSRDEGVLAASVTRFELDALGSRRSVAMYRRGIRQQVPHLSDDRTVHGGGRCRTGG
jgi:Tfp pilus assembly ATPase PilU